MWFDNLLKVGLNILVSENENDTAKKCELIGWHKEGYFILSGDSYSEIIVNNSLYIKFISKGVLYSFYAVIKFIYTEPFRCFIIRIPEEVKTLSIRKEKRVEAYIVGTMLRTMNGKYIKMNILLKDISPSGALVEVRGVCRNCVVNENITLSFPLPDGTMINDIAAEIRNVGKYEDRSVIGIMFVNNKMDNKKAISDFFEKESEFFVK